MYEGRIVRELEGADLNETNIIASALNIEARAGDMTGPANA
jgi:ribose transport system ATP-binding protein